MIMKAVTPQRLRLFSFPHFFPLTTYRFEITNRMWSFVRHNRNVPQTNAPSSMISRQLSTAHNDHSFSPLFGNRPCCWKRGRKATDNMMKHRYVLRQANHPGGAYPQPIWHNLSPNLTTPHLLYIMNGRQVTFICIRRTTGSHHIR